MRRDIVAGGARVHTLSIIMHNFMDAGRLEEDRISACAFKVATGDGPVSMCLHNARRDAFILKPVRIYREGSPWFWNPATGDETADAPVSVEPDRAAAARKGRGRLLAQPRVPHRNGI